MDRKLIQISTNNPTSIFGLADDGSVWEYDLAERKRWRRIRHSIPQKRKDREESDDEEQSTAPKRVDNVTTDRTTD